MYNKLPKNNIYRLFLMKRIIYCYNFIINFTIICCYLYYYNNYISFIIDSNFVVR